MARPDATALIAACDKGYELVNTNYGYFDSAFYDAATGFVATSHRHRWLAALEALGPGRDPLAFLRCGSASAEPELELAPITDADAVTALREHLETTWNHRGVDALPRLVGLLSSFGAPLYYVWTPRTRETARNWHNRRFFDFGSPGTTMIVALPDDHAWCALLQYEGDGP